MLKYVKVVDDKTGLCCVGFGTNAQYYRSIGYIEADVEQSDIDNEWYLSSLCPKKSEEQKALEKRTKLDELSLTRADVERGLYKAKGMDFDDMIELVKDNPDIDLKALKIELKANNFYRKNPYIKKIGLILGFNEKQLDDFFETKDYTKLLS